MTRRRLGLSIRPAAILVACLWGAVVAMAATTERVVVDPRTGFAMSGFDPVEVFVSGRVESGVPGREAVWQGASWRFVNEGNRRAFVAHPQVYAPRFGGFDPVALARGSLAEGDPQIFVLANDRLYLFFSTANATAFIQARDGFIAQAERNWPRLQRTLAR